MRVGSLIAVAVVYTVAEAPIQPLPWELPYAKGAALKKKSKKKHYSMDIFICMMDSLCHTPETNTPL